MERLTRRGSERQDFVLVDRPRGALCRTNFCNIADRCVHIPDRSCPYLMISDRLAAIEDILGDEYDLDELREMVQANIPRLIDEQPTISAVPVVRCRECRHSSLPSGFTQRYGKPGTLSCHFGPCNRRNVNGNDFCSYGQRKIETVLPKSDAKDESLEGEHD